MWGYDGHHGQCRSVKTSHCSGHHSTNTTCPRTCRPGCSYTPDHCRGEKDSRPYCPKFDAARSSSAPPKKKFTDEVGASVKKKNSPRRPKSVNAESTGAKPPVKNEKRNGLQRNLKTPTKKKEPRQPEEPKSVGTPVPIDEPLLSDSKKVENTKSETKTPDVDKLKEEAADTVEEHEYLHFLLGITEDILRNNMYTNNGMDEVFESHLQANKGRLDEQRMKDEIEKLKKELNYPLKTDSLASICMCDQSLDESLEECKCCPAYDTDPESHLRKECFCTNIDCPSHNPAGEERNENKREENIGDNEVVLPQQPDIVINKEKEIDNLENEAPSLEKELSVHELETQVLPSLEKELLVEEPLTQELASLEQELPVEEPEIQKVPSLEKELQLEELETQKVPSLEKELQIEEPETQKVPSLEKELQLEEPETQKVSILEELPVEEPEPHKVSSLEKEVAIEVSETQEAPIDLTAKPQKTDAEGRGIHVAAKKGHRKCPNPEYCRKSKSPSPAEGTGDKDVGHEILTRKMSSAIKIVGKDNTVSEQLSHMVVFNPEIGSETCHCSINPRTTALKIQGDKLDENQEYILVDVPVCIPKTMLEEKTVPVMIENVSSMSIESNHVLGQKAPDNTPDGSLVNLLQKSIIPVNIGALPASVSVYMTGGPEPDMHPERENSEEELRVSAAVRPVTIHPDTAYREYRTSSAESVEKPQLHGDEKYHYLLQDASTSVSSTDLQKSAALYLVQTTALEPLEVEEPTEEPIEEPIDEYRRIYHPLESTHSPNVFEVSSRQSSIESTPKIFDYPPPIKKTASPVSVATPKHFEHAFTRKHNDSLADADSAVEKKDSITSETGAVYPILQSESIENTEKSPVGSDTSLPPQRQPVERETYDHQHIIEKLDEIPDNDQRILQLQTIDAITKKLQDFRTIDKNDAVRRKFKYVNPDENFEIRRRSIETPLCNDDSNRLKHKQKSKCCGLGQT